MYIDVARGVAEVRDADNCAELEIRVSTAARSDLDSMLRAAGLGYWDGGDEAEISLQTLKEAAQRAGVADDWPQRWNGMIAYAGKKGWLTDDAKHVRAHLVTPSR